MENELFNELFGYLKSENLTDLESSDFFEKYKDPNGDQFKELFKYLKSEDLTDLSAEDFSAKYFGIDNVIPEKKNPDNTPIVPGGPGYTAPEEDMDSLSTQTDPPPSSESGLDTADVVEDVDEGEVYDISKEYTGNVVGSKSFDTKDDDYNDARNNNTLLERTFGYNAFTDFFGDIYRGSEVGSVQADAVDHFMEVMEKKTSEVTETDIQNFIEAQKRLESQPESDEMKEFKETVAASGGGFLGYVTGFMNNFSIAPAILVQSVTSMFNAASGKTAGIGAAGGFLVGAGAGALATSWSGPGSVLGGLFTGAGGAMAGAIGGATYSLETALSFAEFLKEEIDKRNDLQYDVAGIMAVLSDDSARNRIENRAIARGLTIAGVEAITLGFSKGAVGAVARIGTAGASKGLLKGSIKGARAVQASNLAATATGVLTEGIGGSAGEALGRVAAGQEMDGIDIFLEGIAGTATAPISVSRGLLKVPRYKINNQFVSQEKFDQKVETLTEKELASSVLGMEAINDPARQRIITNARSFAQLALEVDPNITEEVDQKLVVKGEYALRAIKNPDLETSKTLAKQLKNALKIVSDKYNGLLDERAKNELMGEGVENPTPEQIKEKSDAIFKSETAILDAQKSPRSSESLGKNVQGEQKESTDKSSQENQNQDESATTEKTKVTEKQAVKALKDEGNAKPTKPQIKQKLIDLQLEVDKINEETTESTDENLNRNTSEKTEVKTEDGAKIKVDKENVSENLSIYQGAKIVGQVATKSYNRIVNVAKLGAKSLAKVLPKVKMVLVENQDTYNLLAGRKILDSDGKFTGKYANTGGKFDVKNNTIYINTSLANNSTIAHEIGHAIFVNSIKGGEKAITAVTERLFASLKRSGALKRITFTDPQTEQKINLEDFLDEFTEGAGSLKSEESLVEAIGVVAGNFTRFNVEEQGLIKRFVSKLVELMSKKFPQLKKYLSQYTKTDKEVVDFLNILAGKIAEGGEITSQDLSLLDKIAPETTEDTSTETAPQKKKPKKKAKTKKNIVVDKKKPKKKSKPKKGDVKDDIEKANERFQNNYREPVSGMTFSYDVNSKKFTDLEKQGFINKEKSIKDFNKKQIVFHSPDSAFSGTIKLRNKQVIVEGKGGLNYPIKFHEDGSFWASTEAGADTLVKLLNDSYVANGGKVLMALTSAPKEKLLSSTTMSNAVLDFFNKGVSKLGRSVIEGGIKAAASFQRETTFIDPKTKKQKTKLSGLNLDIKENESYSSVLKKIRTKLSATNSTFPDRKVFSEELIRYMAAEINANLELQKRFTKILGSGIQNKYFKGSPVKGTKGVIKKISFANLKEGLSTMLTAPVLKDLQKSGLVYAIVELDSKVEKVKSDQHESYPFAIKASTKGQKSYLNILTDRVKWSDVALDPSTGNFIAEDNITTIMPTVMGLSTSGLFINTDQVATPGELTLGQGLDSTQDRFQISMDRLIKDYNVNDRGFMPANIFNLGLLKRQAKEFGLGVQEAKFREGYRRGEVSGYYFTRGFTQKGKPKFFNPRSRYQLLGSSNPIDVIIDARKNNISEAAIKIALQAAGFTPTTVQKSLEDADFYTDISSNVPSSFIDALGEKEGKTLYDKLISYVRKANVANAKLKGKFSAKKIGQIVSDFELKLIKAANIATPEQIEKRVKKFAARYNKKNSKTKFSQDEIDNKIVEFSRLEEIKRQDLLIAIQKKVAAFQKKQISLNEKRKAKLTQAQIIDNVLTELQNTDEYKAAKGKKAGKSDLQNLMINQLLANLSTKATINISQKLIDAKKIILDKFGKVKVLDKKNVFYIQTELINLVKKTIPLEAFNNPAVVQLLQNIRDISKPGENVQNIINDTESKINEVNNKFLLKEIESLLEQSYQKSKGGILKADKINNDIRERIKKIYKLTLLSESGKLTAEELQTKVAEQNKNLQGILKNLENKMSGTAKEILNSFDKQSDIQLAMQINNALVTENKSASKVEELSFVLENITSLLQDGSTALQIAKKQKYIQYMSDMSRAYEAIIGKKINISNPDEVAAAKKELSDASNKKENELKDKMFLGRFYGAIASFIKNARDTVSAVELLVAKLDILPGELYGGTMQELVYEKMNESSYAFKEMAMNDKAAMMEKAMEIFAPKGKLTLNIGTPFGLGRKRKTIKALRRMNSNKVTLLQKIGKTLNINRAGGRVDAQGNSIYSDLSLVEAAEKDYAAAKKTRNIFKIRNANKNLNNVIQEQSLNLSDGEVLYLYNQYKDASLHVNFEANQKLKDHKRIMKQLTESMSPELIEWADWQTNEFYPALYERYNSVYKKLYHTNLPWNSFFGGRLYLQGIESESINILGNSYGSGDVTVEAASMFSRVKHSNAIEIRNGNNVLSTYLEDMNWFASYAENINDIDKMFKNPLVAEAIKLKQGDKFYSIITKIIDKIATRGLSKEPASRLINLTNDFFIATRIALSPVIAVKQLLSSVTYISDIGAVNWSKSAIPLFLNTATFGVFGKGMRGAAKEIFANSPYLRDRYSSGFQRTIEAYDNTKEVSLIPNSYMQTMMAIGTSFSKVGDVGAIMLGGLPNYLHYKNEFTKTNPDATEQQVIDYAIKKFQRDTKSTQQSSDIQDKDIFQLSGGGWRWLNMFKTTPKQYLRKSMYAQVQIGRKLSAAVNAMSKFENPLTAMDQAGKGSLFQNFRNWMMFRFLMPSSFAYVSMGLPGLLKPDLDDDDKFDLARQTLMGNLGGVMILGDALQMISDIYAGKPYGTRPNSIPLYEQIAAFGKKYQSYKRLRNIEGKEIDAEYAMMQLMATFFDFFGVPASKGFQGFSNISKLQRGGMSPGERYMRMLGFSDYVIEDAFPPVAVMPTGLNRKQAREWNKKQKTKRNTTVKEKRETVGERNARLKKERDAKKK